MIRSVRAIIWVAVGLAFLWICFPSTCPRIWPQQLPVVNRNGVQMYAPDKPFENIYLQSCSGPGCGSGGGGAVSSFNGRTGAITPLATDYSGFFCPIGGCGTSAAIQYMSVACNGKSNSDGNVPSGTDATTCINTLFSTSNANNPVTVWQDAGFSLIGSGGVGLKCPPGGNCTLRGNGGGIARYKITNCSIGSGVAIFTANNNLTAGWTGTLANLTHCTSLTNTTVTVLSTGLSSTQFEVSASGTVASGAETGTFNRVYGTGFILANNANDDAFANGSFYNSGANACTIANGSPSAQGSNITIRDLVINGNANGQSAYCMGVHLVGVNLFLIENTVIYNASHFSILLDNATNGVIHGNSFFSSSSLIGAQTDGLHFDAFTSNISVSDNYFKTGDDAVALNAYEGLCGPIKNITIDGVNLDDSFSFMRAYNEDLNTCPNGSVPLISNVTVSNVNGSVANAFFRGNASHTELGTLNPALKSFQFKNVNINVTTASGSTALFELGDNTDAFQLSNFIWDSPVNSAFIDCVENGSPAAQALGSWDLNNVRILDTPSGSSFRSLFGSSCTSGSSTMKSLTVHGFGVNVNGGATATMASLFPSPPGGGMGSLSMSDIDVTNAPIFDTTVSWYPSLLSNVFVMAPGGMVTGGITVAGNPTTSLGNAGGGGMGYFGNFDGTHADCNFGGAISVYGCAGVYFNGSLHHIPIQ